MDLVPPRLLPARTRAVAAVSTPVPGAAGGRPRHRPRAVLRRSRPPRRAPGLHGLSGALASSRMGRLQQAPPELLSKGGGPEAVLAYLSRYTHRIAIANSRLGAFDGERVTFRWKDYRAKSAARYKLMTLDVDEFVRRPTGSTASATMASSPMPPGPPISHWSAGSSAHPTQPRRAARAITPRCSRKPTVGHLSLLRRAHDHCRDLRTRLPAPAFAPPSNPARHLVTNTLLLPSLVTAPLPRRHLTGRAKRAVNGNCQRRLPPPKPRSFSATSPFRLHPRCSKPRSRHSLSRRSRSKVKNQIKHRR